MLTITIVLLTVFFVYQVLFSYISKRNISKGRSYVFLGITSIDFLISGIYLVGIYFKFNYILLSFLNLLITVNFLLFFIFYTNMIQTKFKINQYIFIFVTLGISGFLSLFNGYVSNETYIILMMMMLISYFITFKFRELFSSEYFKVLTILFFINEVIRYSLIHLVTFGVFEDVLVIFVIALIFILKTFSLNMLTQIHEVKFIDKNLAQVLDYISPSRLLSITYTENPDAIVLTNKKEKILFANPQSYKNTGYNEEEVIGMTPRVFSSGLTNRATYDQMKEKLTNKETWVGEFVNKKKDNTIFTEQAKIISLLDIDQEPMFFLAIKNDISKEKSYLTKLENLSNIDQLTNLKRRHHFVELTQTCLEVNPESNHYFALIDFDGFKKLNDTYGHIFGDESLKFFARTISIIFDDYGYTCRFGGDEFGIYLTKISKEMTKSLFEKLFFILENTSLMEDKEIYLKISVGLTKLVKPYFFEESYKLADEFLYEAKKINGNSITSNF